MKKKLSLALCVMILMSSFYGCGIKPSGNNSDNTNQSENESSAFDTAASSSPNTASSENTAADTEKSEENTADSTASDKNTTDTAKNEESKTSSDNSDMFTSRDNETTFDESKAVKIELNGTSAKASSNSVKVSGSTVTITEDTTHIISGSLDNGMIIVDAPDTAKIQLVFDGVNITSGTSAPLYIKKADKVFVTLVGENTLANGGTFTAVDENNIDGAVFSKQDLTFNGSGSLTVSSPIGHGIVCKDDLVFTGGNFTITSASHAVDSNDSVRIKNTVISADSGKDGIHSENTDDSTKGFVYIDSGTLDIECEGDGISSGSYMQICDGTINILAAGGYENGAKKSSDNWGGFGGGMHGNHPGEPMPMQISTETVSETATGDESSSTKGLKSTDSILIEGGTFTINSADDAIHSKMSAAINGGTFEISTGDDAVHSDESLTINAGKINITNSYEGLEACNVVVNGGDIKLVSTDDGLNGAGGTDSSGMTGGRDGMFGGNIPGGKNFSNSTGSIVISGGTLSINASGDGIDSNGTLEITGGHTTVAGPTQGDTSTLDFDISGTISGGTFIGTGASHMSQSLASSGQGFITISLQEQSANSKIILKDKSGNEIITHSPELPFQLIELSNPDIKSGETYIITVGSQSYEVVAD